MKLSDHETLERTRLFWNASPCGAQETFQQRRALRYGVEPWIEDVLQRVVARQRHVVEIGCGQGTDGIVLCSLLPPHGSYVGIDYSDDSVKSAMRALREARSTVIFHVEPVFRTGNAEQIDLADSSVDCIYSNGVLHHTANASRAFDEIWRVLKPGGEAFLTLYRRPSLKVGAAKAIRRVQAVADAMLGQDRCFYWLVQHHSASRRFGTMLLEGVGVPVMEWYSAADIRKMFSRWDILALERVGCNLPRLHPRSRGWTRFGYMWLLHLRKQDK